MKKILIFVLLLMPVLLYAQDKDLSDLSIPELAKLINPQLQAYRGAVQRKDKQTIAHSLRMLGDIYLNIGKNLADQQQRENTTKIANDKKANLDRSIDYSNQAIVASEDAGDKELLRDAYKNLAAAQKLEGRIKEAAANYSKFVSLKKVKNLTDVEKKQIEAVHGKKEDSLRKAQLAAEESLREQERALQQKQHQLDSANRAISDASKKLTETNKTLTKAEQDKQSVSLALQKSQTDLSLEKQTAMEKEKQLSLAEQEKALQATNLALTQSKLELQQNQVEIQKEELQIKDRRLGEQRRYILAGLISLIVLSGFTFFIIRERRKAVRQKLRAERSERFKQEFIANISHEIRTPMNAINGMTGLLLQKNPRPDQESYLKAITKSADILLHVINDVLDLSKIEAGKLELETIDFSLSDTVQQVKDTLAYRAEDKGLQLITTIDDNVADVLVGDPYRLNQVLVNLTGNALKFTEKGGVHIDIKLERKEGDNLFVKYSIIDTGIGIPADKVANLFANFAQVNSSDTRKYGGTGLGLAISKYLVELHGGKISIESVVGSGTTFYFTIKYPIGSAARLQERIAAEQNADGSILNGLRILIADDNEYNRLVVDETLHLMAELTTELVVNGQEAVDMMERNEYDLILMDVQMPVMNGLDATRAIRAQIAPPKNKIPIIALTASVLRADIDMCYESGMNAYVPKPFKPWQLINTIAEVTGRERVPGTPPPVKKAATPPPPPPHLSNSQPQEEQSAVAIEPSVYMQTGDMVTSLDYLTKFCEGDEKRMKKYIKVYLNALPAFRKNIDAAVATKDYVEIALHVHSFKPKWMMMGMKQTNELGIKIDHMCKNENDKVFDDLSILMSDIEKSVTELEHMS